MSVRKQFDPQLYEENDKKARKALKKILKGNKVYVAEDSIKRTDVDMVVMTKRGHICNIELEIKRVWKTKDFPYENVQIPERKSKYCKLGKPTLFVMFNEDQSEYLVIRDRDLINSPLAVVPNKYVYKGEKFFQVPMDKARFGGLLDVLDEVAKSQLTIATK